MKQIKKFSEEFFRNLKCNISREGDILVVDNVPKSFEDLFGKKAPYRFCFSADVKDAEFVGKGSILLMTIRKFLEGAGKATLLKIDFDVDAEREIGKVISLKNCEIESVARKHRNSFFSRFTFVTTFRYLNESDRVVNEIYVHNGKVVAGNLDGYVVTDGSDVVGQRSDEEVKGDYDIARDTLKGMLDDKVSEIRDVLEVKADDEVDRIKEHYENLLGELGGDLSEKLGKVEEVELALRSAEDSGRGLLRARLDRLRKGLVKVGDDDARERIMKEREFTLKDAMHRFSLNVDKKLVNTTVIYYPVYVFSLCLKSDAGVGAGRCVEMSYDPLTRTVSKLNCESCGVEIRRLSLCSSGHVTCDDCLRKCGECGKVFCDKCLKKSCSACGKLLCKSCALVCIGCGSVVCSTHMRKDCVSGDDRCVSCLRACMRCHGMAQEKFFGEALDGSKVCLKCIGVEKRDKVMGRVFRGG